MNQSFRGEALLCKCGKDLTQIEAERSDIPTYGERDGIDLVEMIARGTYCYTGADAIGEFVQGLEKNPVWNTANKGSAPWLATLQDKTRKLTISYRSVLRLSYLTGVSVAHIFSDPQEAATIAGQLFVDRNVMKSNHANPSDEAIYNFEKNISACLASDDPIATSFMQFCHKHTVSVSLARFRHPEKCAEYMRRRRGELRARVLGQLQIVRAACRRQRDELGDDRFFSDIAATAVRIASITEAPRYVVLRALRPTFAMRACEAMKFKALVESLPLKIDDKKALLEVTAAFHGCPVAQVFPGDLAEPISQLARHRSPSRVNVRDITLALHGGYKKLGLTKYGGMTGAAGYGTWQRIIAEYGRATSSEFKWESGTVEIVREYWSLLLQEGHSSARLSFFISLGCPRLDMFYDALRSGRVHEDSASLSFQPRGGSRLWTIPVPSPTIAMKALELGVPRVGHVAFWRDEYARHRRIVSQSSSLEAAFGGALAYWPFRSLVKVLMYESLKRHKSPRASLALCMALMQGQDSEGIRRAVVDTLADWMTLLVPDDVVVEPLIV